MGISVVTHSLVLQQLTAAIAPLQEAVTKASAEPLTIRHASVNGKRYFYLLNTGGAELEVRVSLRDAGQVRPLSPDASLTLTPTELAGTLGAYELAAYECSTPDPKLGPAQVTLPDWQLARLHARLEELRALAAGDERGEQIVSKCEELLRAKRYRTLEVTLWSYQATRLEWTQP